MLVLALVEGCGIIPAEPPLCCGACIPTDFALSHDSVPRRGSGRLTGGGGGSGGADRLAFHTA